MQVDAVVVHASQEELGKGLADGDVALVAVGVDVGEVVGYGIEPDLLGGHAASPRVQSPDHPRSSVPYSYRRTILQGLAGTGCHRLDILYIHGYIVYTE